MELARWLAVMIVFGTGAAHAQSVDSAEHQGAAANGARAGAYLPYTSQASLSGYRGFVMIDAGYDGIRTSAMERVRAEVVLLHGALSLFGGGRYGAPDLSVSPHASGFGGVRIQGLRQHEHAVDLTFAASYNSLGFNQLPAVVGELALARSLGIVRCTVNATYGQATRDGDRFGGLALSILAPILPVLYLGADSRASTDLERDQEEPAFEPQYELLASALLGYVGPWLAVQLRAGVRALQYRLQTYRHAGPELGVSVATAL